MHRNKSPGCPIEGAWDLKQCQRPGSLGSETVSETRQPGIWNGVRDQAAWDLKQCQRPGRQAGSLLYISGDAHFIWEGGEGWDIQYNTIQYNTIQYNNENFYSAGILGVAKFKSASSQKPSNRKLESRGKPYSSSRDPEIDYLKGGYTRPKRCVF